MLHRVPPRVRDVSDPVILGTHPAHSGVADDFESTNQLPPYVLRDADAALRQALEMPGFVLVTGDAATGKTRSAFEAVRTVLPDHILIAPSGPESISAAVEAAVATRMSILWLDDLDSYLEPGGLTPSQIDEILAGHDHHRVILATLRSTLESRLRSSSPDARAVLDKARQVSLNRVFSLEEKNRGRSLDDARIAEALAHTDKYGVGEYLTSGPRLLPARENAWARGTHPNDAELIAAVVADVPTDKAVTELLALTERDAASIINRCNVAVGANLLSAIAIPEGRADIAWRLLQMLLPDRQGRLLDYMSSTAAAALLALPSAEEAIPIVKRSDIRTVVGALSEMDSGRAARLVMAMDVNRATEVLRQTSPKRIADILRNVSPDNRRQLLNGLPENFRASALRYLSGGT